MHVVIDDFSLVVAILLGLLVMVMGLYTMSTSLLPTHFWPLYFPLAGIKPSNPAGGDESTSRLPTQRLAGPGGGQAGPLLADSPRSPASPSTSALALAAATRKVGRIDNCTPSPEIHIDGSGHLCLLADISATSLMTSPAHLGNPPLRPSFVRSSWWARLVEGRLFDISRLAMGVLLIVQTPQLIQMAFWEQAKWPWLIIDMVAWLALSLEPIHSATRIEYDQSSRLGGFKLGHGESLDWSRALETPFLRVFVITLTLEAVVGLGLVVLYWPILREWTVHYAKAWLQCRRHPNWQYLDSRMTDNNNGYEDPDGRTAEPRVAPVLGAELTGADAIRTFISSIVIESLFRANLFGADASEEMAESSYEDRGSSTHYRYSSGVSSYPQSPVEPGFIDVGSRSGRTARWWHFNLWWRDRISFMRSCAVRVVGFVILDALLVPITRVYLTMLSCVSLSPDPSESGPSTVVLNRAPELRCWDSSTHLALALFAAAAAVAHLVLALWFASRSMLAVPRIILHPRLAATFVQIRIFVLTFQVFNVAGSPHLLPWILVVLCVVGLLSHTHFAWLKDTVPRSMLVPGRLITFGVTGLAACCAVLQTMVASRSSYVCFIVFVVLSLIAVPVAYQLMWHSNDNEIAALEKRVTEAIHGTTVGDVMERMDVLEVVVVTPLYREFLFSSPLVASLLHQCLTGEPHLLLSATRTIGHFSVEDRYARAFLGASAIQVIATYVVSSSPNAPLLQLEGIRTMLNLLSHGVGCEQFVMQGYMNLVTSLFRRGLTRLILGAMDEARQASAAGRQRYSSLYTESGDRSTRPTIQCDPIFIQQLTSETHQVPDILALALVKECLKIFVLLFQTDVGKDAVCTDASIALDLVAVIMLATQPRKCNPLVVFPINAYGGLTRHARWIDLARGAVMAFAQLSAGGSGVQRSLLVELGITEIASRMMRSAPMVDDKLHPLMLFSNLAVDPSAHARVTQADITWLSHAQGNPTLAVSAAMALHNLGYPTTENLRAYLRPLEPETVRSRPDSETPVSPPLVFQSPLLPLSVPNVRRKKKSLARRALVNSAIGKQPRVVQDTARPQPVVPLLFVPGRGPQSASSDNNTSSEPERELGDSPSSTGLSPSESLQHGLPQAPPVMPRLRTGASHVINKSSPGSGSAINNPLDRSRPSLSSLSSSMSTGSSSTSIESSSSISSQP